MRVAIGCDHAGFELKESLKSFLIAGHRDVLDVGTHDGKPTDYPGCAEAVGAALRHDRAERGILLCGSGVGASMAANRIPGVRAGLCHDTYSAHQGVEHDGMNVLVLGGRVVGVELARELADAFLNANFSGDARHLRRLAKMTAPENPVRALQVFGQSVWLDYIRRSLITSGELAQLIDDDGLRGVTSNPAIFENAISGSADYREVFQDPHTRTLGAKALYETLAIADVQQAADVLRPVFSGTDTRDGYVSLEVSPELAHDTAGTMDEARRLWQSIARENVMIKVPATPEGIAAIQPLIADGINVNATLLFSQAAYEQVAEAFIAGLETRAARGGDLARVASVASFFVSRIDNAIEALVEARLEGADPDRRAALRALSGRVAIANARLAYQRYLSIFGTPRWKALAAAGAHTQRLLWASTGVKNPSYRDVLYVEELIGPDTVNTVPPATFDAFRDHGRPRASLTEDVDAARDTLTQTAELGIDLDEVTAALLSDGLRIVSVAFDRLLKAIDQERASGGAGRTNRLTSKLPPLLATAVNTSLDEWREQNNVSRLWARDASLWTGRDEAQWLGWLGITNDQLAHIQRLVRVGEVAKTAAGVSHVLLLGMGGSSLGPEVLTTTFERVPGFPELHVLDSIVPAQVRAIERRIDFERTLFVVSSKSGSTLEPNILRAYFYDRVEQMIGRKRAGHRFLAITDPGSWMQQVAERDGFRRVFLGWPNIGGRYSVLSDFGLVPAAIMGLDVPAFLNRADEMVGACMPSVPVEENPGVMLGTILGIAARFGRDKLTLVTSPQFAHLGAWIEQLVAESTGKDGKGIIPIDRERLGTPGQYDDDRLFVYLGVSEARDAEQARLLDALEESGHPVVRITLDDAYDVGQEFFRWEFATAVAGSILGVHPFDQPDVEASKIATRRLTDEFEARGSLPAEKPVFTGDGLSIFMDDANAAALLKRVKRSPTLEDLFAAHLGRLERGDYFAMLAYIEMSEAHERALQVIRHAVRDATGAATCLQFGPRFLHSTGQAYKGGPNTGVFLQITSDDEIDVPVPGRKYTFGAVKAAQARGDFQVLAERARRAIRVHLGADVSAGIRRLHAAIAGALDRQSRPARTRDSGARP